jgi:N-acetyl-beta-hexosaminidase
MTHIGGEELYEGFWLGSLKVRDHWEDLGVGGRIILKWTLRR